MAVLNNTLSFLIAVIFQVALLFILYFFLRLLFRQELGWKFFYAALSFLIVFLIGAIGAPSLLAYVLEGSSVPEERFVIRDANSFVVLLMELSVFSAALLTFPVGLIFLFTYVSESLTVNEKYIFKSFLIVFFYLYLVTLFIVDQDLSISAWDSLLAADALPLRIQFQPDLEFLFLSYRGEWVDFFLFVITELLLFFSFYSGFLSKFWRQPRVHFLFLFFHLLSIFYFFGGEGWLFDSSLLLFSLFLFEVIYFQLRILFYLKTKKTVNNIE